jgi:hypothetical protein
MENKFLILSLLLGVSVFGQNEENQKVSPWKNIEFNLGVYLTDVSTQARIGSNTLGLGIGADLEKALGMETSSFVFHASGLFRYRKKKKSFIKLGYFEINRKSTKTLEAEIELFDKSFSQGTIISSKIDMGIITLSYGHSFFKTQNFDVGFTAGFFVMPISIGFDAIDSKSSTKASSDQTSFIAPLPVLGFYTNFAFTPKLIMRQSINMFYLKVDNFKGSLTELNMCLEYNAWKNVGFGLGLNSFSLNFEAVTKSDPPFDFQGQFGYKLSGVVVYIKGNF